MPPPSIAARDRSLPITRQQIEDVHRLIAPHIRVTPTMTVSGSDFGLAPFPITLKLEHLQRAGTFKTRGAFTNLLTRNVPAAGVVAASGGNHGAAVAFAAQALGHSARIFVPTIASPTKIDRIRSYGATLIVGGALYADALAASEAWAQESGALPIHAFDQRETMLGQATLGRELSAQAPQIETLLVGVGGGGLIGGIAAWYASDVTLIGVEPRDAPTLTAALAAGRPVDAPAGGIAADSLAPKRVGDLMFPIACAHINRVLLVDDDDIRRAQQVLWDVTRLVVEPGGAAAFSALVAGQYVPAPTEHVGVVLSGANTNHVPPFV